MELYPGSMASMRVPAFGNAAPDNKLAGIHKIHPCFGAYREDSLCRLSANDLNHRNTDGGPTQARHPHGSGILKAFPASSGQQKRNMECSP
jgi:hypothetical protein